MIVKSVQSVSRRVVQHEFTIMVAGELVPAVLWTPKNQEARALIAMGHGGSQSKTSKNLRARALRYAGEFAWASLAIDAPKHGERISPQEAELERARTLARVQGKPNAVSLSVEEKIKFLDDLAAKAVPEWRAALDAVFASGLVVQKIPLAYWGVSQGSSIGIPLLATDKRFCCAVLGLAQLHPDHEALRACAKQITIPLRFAFQWNDAIRERDYGLALFNAFASEEKSMHINPGGHLEIPDSEAASWDIFFRRHLAT